jgi:hypothetical protein
MQRVFGQRTEHNERICSLLSAVFQRSIRPQFTRAILEKSAKHDISILRPNAPAVVCVQRLDETMDIVNLKYMIKQILNDYGFKFVEVFVGDQRPSDDLA